MGESLLPASAVEQIQRKNSREAAQEQSPRRKPWVKIGK